MNYIELTDAILVDARNWSELKPLLLEKMSRPKQLIGFDIETDDEQRHAGLNAFMKIDPEGFRHNKKLVFDVRRTTVDGFSLYFNGETVGYYINLHHSDVENRVPWEEAKQLLDAKTPDSTWVIHNATFEKVMMEMSLGYDLGDNIICTLQLAVTAYNDDTYDHAKFLTPGLGEIEKLLPQAARVFAAYEPKTPLSAEQEELVFKVTAKESKAAHSWNGYVKTIRYGFALKECMKSHFNYDQMTFEECLQGAPHMGAIPGTQVVKYGADDAWACVQLLHSLLRYIFARNPNVWPTFTGQEMGMINHYVGVQAGGLRLDVQKVRDAQDLERVNYAKSLRTMKEAIKQLLPFPEELHEKLQKYDDWYSKNGDGYRVKVMTWAQSPDSADDYTICQQVRGAVPKSWALERGKPESVGLSINHYMPMRTILYDLCGCSYQQFQGKTQSDAETRERMKFRWVKKHSKLWPEYLDDDIESKTLGKVLKPENAPDDAEALKRYHAVLQVLSSYEELAGIEQRIKLYITPYLYLVDPETGRVYPSLSSRLNSRRMACQNPNGQQLAKYGGSSYVRSFFLADEDDHVLVSLDWSAIELVLIGEASGDAKFAEAFGKLPHDDLHRLAVMGLMNMAGEAYDAHPDRKKLRTDIGKGSNFGYWFSGGLGTTARTLGWSSEEHWEKVDAYRNTFPEAESWRVGVIQFGREHGYVELPDGHRRYRYEATYEWQRIMRDKFALYGNEAISKFGDIVIKKIQTRAGNQLVNARIQGTCATLAKRSIPRIVEMMKREGIRGRFWLAIHDEVVSSVHKDDVIRYIKLAKEIMCDHPELVSKLKLYSSASIGRNFEPYKPEKQELGQVELDELPKKADWLPERLWGNRAETDEDIQLVLDHMFA